LRSVSKAIKNIAVFSLWLAGLVIITHLLIPHDHHFDSSACSKEEVCQANNTKHPVKTPGFPLHCHGLNELAFEKMSFNVVVNQNFPTCLLFIAGFINSGIQASGGTSIKLKDFSNPFTDHDFLRLPPFRAPPSLI
jgi:hypothetical protein